MSLPNEVEVPRALVLVREPLEAIALHAFGDTSAQGVAAAVYAVSPTGVGIRSYGSQLVDQCSRCSIWVPDGIPACMASQQCCLTVD